MAIRTGVGRATVTIIAAAAALVLYVAAVRYENRPYEGNARLGVGDRAPQLKMWDAVTGARVSLGHWSYVFVDYIAWSRPQDLENAAYASLLSERDAHAKTKIGYLFITGRRYPELDAMRSAGEMTVPLIQDHHRSIERALELHDGEDEFLILNRARQVLFHPRGGADCC